MNDRDRDSGGRPRNARPRDALGRPLPYGAPGIDRVPEDVVLSPDEAVRRAQRLIDEGCPFHAHEVFEGVWKATSGAHRELWRGLAQLAVGLTHLQRGNAKGAVALLRRAADRLDPYSAEAPHRLDIAGLASHARRLADQGSAITAAELQPRLQRHDTEPAPPGQVSDR
ncbi:MAG: DUF309 domain-containing protein [Actinomycetota bacterium]|jgi:hypothetical protein|nr:DUF309 domain-containing protein [Actinomycetota bacterium]